MNLFVSNSLFLYPLKTENRKVSLCFQGLKGSLGTNVLTWYIYFSCGVCLDPWFVACGEECYETTRDRDKSVLTVFTEHWNWKGNLENFYKFKASFRNPGKKHCFNTWNIPMRSYRPTSTFGGKSGTQGWLCKAWNCANIRRTYGEPILCALYGARWTEVYTFFTS